MSKEDKLRITTNSEALLYIEYLRSKTSLSFEEWVMRTLKEW